MTPSQRDSLKRLGLHVGVFTAIFLAVFLILLWAGVRTFPGQDAVPNEGAALFFDELAMRIRDTLFMPFQIMGYEFMKLFGATLWFAVAAFWSTLAFFPYLALTAAIRRKRNPK